MEDAQKALSLNGKEYKEHHIRVNIVSEKQKPDKSRAIFLGNVSFGKFYFEILLPVIKCIHF